MEAIFLHRLPRGYMSRELVHVRTVFGANGKGTGMSASVALRNFNNALLTAEAIKSPNKPNDDRTCIRCCIGFCKGGRGVAVVFIYYYYYYYYYYLLQLGFQPVAVVLTLVHTIQMNI
jgi:hypothetical protein